MKNLKTTISTLMLLIAVVGFSQEQKNDDKIQKKIMHFINIGLTVMNHVKKNE